MEELIILKQLLHQGKVTEALELVEELEEMSNPIKSIRYLAMGIILLLHLIKQAAENRTTRFGIFPSECVTNSTHQSGYKAKGTYLLEEELAETLQDAYELALNEPL